MKFNGPSPKKITYYIRVDEEMDRDVMKYNIHKSKSARDGIELAIEKAKKRSKK